VVTNRLVQRIVFCALVALVLPGESWAEGGDTSDYHAQLATVEDMEPVDEWRAWNRFLSDYPESPYRDRIERRMAELSDEVPEEVRNGPKEPPPAAGAPEPTSTPDPPQPSATSELLDVEFSLRLGVVGQPYQVLPQMGAGMALQYGAFPTVHLAAHQSIPLWGKTVTPLGAAQGLETTDWEGGFGIYALRNGVSVLVDLPVLEDSRWSVQAGVGRSTLWRTTIKPVRSLADGGDEHEDHDERRQDDHGEDSESQECSSVESESSFRGICTRVSGSGEVSRTNDLIYGVQWSPDQNPGVTVGVTGNLRFWGLNYCIGGNDDAPGYFHCGWGSNLQHNVALTVSWAL